MSEIWAALTAPMPLSWWTFGCWLFAFGMLMLGMLIQLRWLRFNRKQGREILDRWKRLRDATNEYRKRAEDHADPYMRALIAEAKLDGLLMALRQRGITVEMTDVSVELEGVTKH